MLLWLDQSELHRRILGGVRSLCVSHLDGDRTSPTQPVWNVLLDWSGEAGDLSQATSGGGHQRKTMTFQYKLQLGEHSEVKPQSFSTFTVTKYNSLITYQGVK